MAEIDAIRPISELEREIRKLETENRKLEMTNYELMKQIRHLEDEVKKLKKEPLVVGSVEEILEDGKTIIKTSNGGQFLVNSILNVKPGDRVAMNQQNLAIIKVLPIERSRSVKATEIIERPNVSFSDIGGLSDQLNDLREVVELPFKRPERFKELGIDPPKGVLLYGPPGCGKTLLAKAVAKESDASFIKVTGSELVRKYIGEGAKLVRQIFEMARDKAPAIIFIDEIDAIAARRLDETTGGDREVNRTLMQLLAEMDGFNENDMIRIIGATNRVDILDPAILRPGRFDRLIEIPMPDRKGREEILRIHTKKMKLSKNVNIKELGRLTEGATGADLKAVCTEAGMFALRKGKKSVSMDEFLDAIEKVLIFEEEEQVYYT